MVFNIERIRKNKEIIEKLREGIDILDELNNRELQMLAFNYAIEHFRSIEQYWEIRHTLENLPDDEQRDIFRQYFIEKKNVIL